MEIAVRAALFLIGLVCFVWAAWPPKLQPPGDGQRSEADGDGPEDSFDRNHHRPPRFPLDHPLATMSADLAGVDLARGLKCLGEMLGRTPATPLEAWVAGHIWSALSNMEHFDLFDVEPEVDCDGLVTGVLTLTVGSEALRITVEQKEPT